MTLSEFLDFPELNDYSFDDEEDNRREVKGDSLETKFFTAYKKP